MAAKKGEILNMGIFAEIIQIWDRYNRFDLIWIDEQILVYTWIPHNSEQLYLIKPCITFVFSPNDWWEVPNYLHFEHQTEWFFFSTDTHYLNMITESALWMITQPHKNKPNFPIKKKAQGFGVSVFVYLCICAWVERRLQLAIVHKLKGHRFKWKYKLCLWFWGIDWHVLPCHFGTFPPEKLKSVRSFVIIEFLFW